MKMSLMMRIYLTPHFEKSDILDTSSRIARGIFNEQLMLDHAHSSLCTYQDGKILLLESSFQVPIEIFGILW